MSDSFGCRSYMYKLKITKILLITNNGGAFKNVSKSSKGTKGRPYKRECIA